MATTRPRPAMTMLRLRGATARSSSSLGTGGGRSSASTLPTNSAPPSASNSHTMRSSPNRSPTPPVCRHTGGSAPVDPRHDTAPGASDAAGGVVELRVRPAEHEPDRARRPGTVLGDDQLGHRLVRRVLVVHLVAVQEHDHVGVLLD